MAGLSKQELVNLTRQEVAWYAGFSDDSKAFFIQDPDRHIYAVNGVRDAPGPKRGFVIVQARVADNYVIIDVDSVWDKNLWKALVKAGIPRGQIVLAYAGEKLPEPSQS